MHADAHLTARKFTPATLARFTPEAIAKGLKVQDLDEEGQGMGEGGVDRLEIAIPKDSMVIIDIYGIHRNRAFSLPSSITLQTSMISAVTDAS